MEHFKFLPFVSFIDYWASQQLRMCTEIHETFERANGYQQQDNHDIKDFTRRFELMKINVTITERWAIKRENYSFGAFSKIIFD